MVMVSVAFLNTCCNASNRYCERFQSFLVLAQDYYGHVPDDQRQDHQILVTYLQDSSCVVVRPLGAIRMSYAENVGKIFAAAIPVCMTIATALRQAGVEPTTIAALTHPG